MRPGMVVLADFVVLPEISTGRPHVQSGHCIDEQYFMCANMRFSGSVRAGSEV